MEGGIAFLIAVAVMSVVFCFIGACFCQENQAEEIQRMREAEAWGRAAEPSAPVDSSVVIEQDISEAVNDAFKV